MIVSGNGKQGYQIQFDDLSAGNQMAYVRRRNIITVVEIGEKEVEYDHINSDLSVIKPPIARDVVEYNNFCRNW